MDTFFYWAMGLMRDKKTLRRLQDEGEHSWCHLLLPGLFYVPSLVMEITVQTGLLTAEKTAPAKTASLDKTTGVEYRPTLPTCTCRWLSEKVEYA